MMRNYGFTFIEVMVAMLIFVLAVLASANITQGSVRATREAKQMSRATWLLQNVMTELETKLETEGVDKGCDKKKDGKFEAPNEEFTYTTFCNEIDIKLSQTAAKMAQAGSDASANEPSKEDILQKAILDTASDYIGKSLREIHTEVAWTQGKQKRKISLTTHFVKYDTPLTLPGIGGGDTSSGGGTTGGGTTGGGGK